MKYIVVLCLTAFAVAFGIVAGYFAWRAFVARDVLTVYQQIAAGTGATAFALFSVACLLAAILQVLWEIKEALEMVRLDVRESRREALQYRYKTHP
jgi:hypothetical protein